MYKIVASDLDGTLLSPNHDITAFTQQTLLRLTKADIHFVFATGRHHLDVSKIKQKIGIEAFMITSNGARVHNPAGELILSNNLAENIVKDIYSLAEGNNNIIANAYSDDFWFINRELALYETIFCDAPLMQYQVVPPKKMQTSNISKIFFMSVDHEMLIKLEEKILDQFCDSVNVSFSMPTCLEVMGANISKGRALKKVAKILGSSLAGCIAFGDGMNDLEMLSMVGKGCIMENGQQRLKTALPQLEIIGKNADDKVAHYLNNLFFPAEVAAVINTQ